MFAPVQNLVLGNLHINAYYGDLGKIAYDHSQASGNPHQLTFSGLLNKPITVQGYGITDIYSWALSASKPSYTTSEVTEADNLYFTYNRVLGTYLEGYVATEGTVSPSDTVLTAIQKLSYRNHNPLTLGSANGLSLDNQQLSLALASGTTTGSLSYSDWTIFNNKQPAGIYSTDIHANIIALDNVSGINTGDQTDITGNAGTAIRLQTSRTINGVSFDGSTNITINAIDATSRIASSLIGVANGVATLGSDTKIPLSQIPVSLLGQVNYKGLWDASTNLPLLPSIPTSNGDYYIVSVAGNTTMGTISEWKVGDWLISNGTTWGKVDNTDAVSSVNGYTGVIVLSKADFGLSNVVNALQWHDGNHPTTVSGYGLPAYPTTLPASDVYAWAKAATKPSYVYSEISGKPTSLSQFTNDLGNYGPFILAQNLSAQSANMWIDGDIRTDSSLTALYYRVLNSGNGTTSSPYYDKIIRGVALDTNESTISFGNEFQHTTGTYIKFTVNSSLGNNTPIDALTLKPSGAATFASSVTSSGYGKFNSLVVDNQTGDVPTEINLYHKKFGTTWLSGKITNYHGDGSDDAGGAGIKFYTNNNSTTTPSLTLSLNANNTATFSSTVSSTGFLLNGNNLTSSLTTNYIPKWNGSNFVNSLISDNGTKAGVGGIRADEFKFAVKTDLDLAFSGIGKRISIFTGNNTDLNGIQLGYTTDGGGIIAPATENGAANYLSFWTYNGGWGERVKILKTGELNVSSTTASISPITGALVVGGGIGVGGNGYFNGTVTASNFILSSDRTLKTNIQPIIKDYSKLNLVSFNFKDNLEELRFGTIAQDLLSGGYSEFVTGDKEGEYKVKYIDLLVAKIAYLEVEINKLKNK